MYFGDLLGNLTLRWLLLDRIVAMFGDKGKEIERFIKFAIVGGFGTLVDFAILNVLILSVGVDQFAANTCSFSVAAFSNFLGNRLWSFPESRERRFVSQLGRFFIVSLGGYLINQTLFMGTSRYLFAGLGTLGYNLAKTLATVVVLFWNFGINRIWTYRGI